MLRFVEFLIFVLHAHAQTLERLAAFFGEEELVALLEHAGEIQEKLEEEGLSRAFTPASLPHSWFVAPPLGPSGSAYAELETAVQSLKLHSRLEFHLWTYPYYRYLIEGEIPLHSYINTDDPQALELLIAQAVSQAKEWVARLPISPGYTGQVEQIASVPWLRFRAELLTHTGKKPVSLAVASP